MLQINSDTQNPTHPGHHHSVGRTRRFGVGHHRHDDRPTDFPAHALRPMRFKRDGRRFARNIRCELR